MKEKFPIIIPEIDFENEKAKLIKYLLINLMYRIKIEHV